jgi:hypothetical protein
MKIRGLVVAAIVFFVLAGLLYWSERHKPEPTTASADTPPPVLKLDEAAITTLEINKKDAPPILLAKSDSGDWQINAPQHLRADQSTVSSMLSTLSSLNSERVVEDKPVRLAMFGLDQPTLQVSLTEKDRKSQKLLLGDDTPTGGAVYAMLAGSLRVYTIPAYAKNSVDKSLNDLRDKRLLTVNADKLSRVELLGKNQDIEFGRNKDEWQILKPQPLPADSSKVDDLVRKLTDARMDLSGPAGDAKQAAAAFAHGTPVASAKVTDQSGTQELQLRKSEDTYYAKSSVVEGAYKVDTGLADALNKKLDDFRDKKLFHFGFSDPKKIGIRNGSKSYSLARNGAEWWSNGKKMDASAVEQVVAKLRDLSADKLLHAVSPSPGIEVSVTSDDGQQVERLSVAKSGDHYVGKREGDPTGYELDTASIDELLKGVDELKPATAPTK